MVCTDNGKSKKKRWIKWLQKNVKINSGRKKFSNFFYFIFKIKTKFENERLESKIYDTWQMEKAAVSLNCKGVSLNCKGFLGKDLL